MAELWQKPGLALGEAIAAKEVSATEVLGALLDRIASVNPQINAIVTLAAATARAEAQAIDERLAAGEVGGPLFGVPVTIKDLIETRGLRTTFGSLFRQDFVPDQDAVLVERLRAAGCPMVGKTNTPEFGSKFATDNKVFGVTRNPWNLERSPGGSSGGAAAQVAAGMGPLAVGNDGGGSIRVPASVCGVYAIKPQFGRIPSWPRHNGWYLLNHEGPDHAQRARCGCHAGYYGWARRARLVFAARPGHKLSQRLRRRHPGTARRLESHPGLWTRRSRGAGHLSISRTGVCRPGMPG